MKPWRFAILLALASTVWPIFCHAYLVNEWEPVPTEGEDQTTVKEAKEENGIWREPVAGISFVQVEAGCFKMGSPPKVEERAPDEGPVHEVCLSSYWMGQTEISQAQWRLVMQNNPSRFRKGDDYPVEMVAWEDVEIFLRRLTNLNQNRYVFRLPTEVEWEYACRSRGQRVRFSGGDDLERVAWHHGNSQEGTMPVESKEPNWLKLFNMSGNVWEWVEDAYRKDAYEKHPRQDPVVEEDTLFRVIRGGSWAEDGAAARCANRGYELFTTRKAEIGFRLVRATPKVTKKQAPTRDLRY